MTLAFPSPVPQDAVVAFTVIMKEAESERLLSTEAKRFAMDTKPPEIVSFDFIEDGMGNLLASATVLDEAASIAFVELLVSRDGGRSFARFPMDWQSGDFLNPTLFVTTFGPLAPGQRGGRDAFGVPCSPRQTFFPATGDEKALRMMEDREQSCASTSYDIS
jgi:hypothetical protein